jgi:hypothetical protein
MTDDTAPDLGSLRLVIGPPANEAGSANAIQTTRRMPEIKRREVVGLGRFERPTSRLSGVRSNQLSYRPRTPGGPSSRRPALHAARASGETSAPRHLLISDIRPQSPPSATPQTHGENP